jgi:hypothetical protein
VYFRFHPAGVDVDLIVKVVRELGARLAGFTAREG